MIRYDSPGQHALLINGETRTVFFSPEETLLQVLRRIGLTGAKPGCENGDCGACTVLLDGLSVKSCLVLALEAIGHTVTTIEGLQNTAIQQAFTDHGGFQCGYCTSGFLVKAYALLESHPEADEALTTDWLRSNLCRCTGYEGIRRAVTAAQENLKKSGTPHK